MQILNTSGGTHPPSMLADLTVQSLISVAPTAKGREAEEGIALREKFRPVLVEAFEGVQREIKTFLTNKDNVQFDKSFVKEEIIDQNLARLIKLSEGNLHEAFFKHEDSRKRVRNVLRNMFATAIDVECRWHSDNLKVKKRS